MKIGLVGLGKMGGNMARRLRQHDIEVVAFNRNKKVADDLAEETGLFAAESLQSLVEQLDAPRVVWFMLPAGEITQQHLELFADLLHTDDIIVDGANSYYKDSIRRGEELAAQRLVAEKSCHYLISSNGQLIRQRTPRISNI